MPDNDEAVEEEAEDDDDQVVEGTEDDRVPERPVELDSVLEEDEDVVAKEKDEARAKDLLSSLLSALAFKSIWVTKVSLALTTAV